MTAGGERYELAIDTASDDVSLVLARVDNGEVVGARAWRTATNVTQELLGAIESLLTEAGAARDEVARIAVDVGPGQYGALRAGIATAQGMALALDVPVAGIGRLDADAALAFGRGARGPVVAVHDARGSAAWAAFDVVEAGDGGVPVEIAAARISRVAEAVAEAPAGATWTGEVFEALREAIAASNTGRGDAEVASGDTESNVTRAHALLNIARARGAYGDAGLVDAVYLRPPPITPPRAT